jgi:hypothetical protein
VTDSAKSEEFTALELSMSVVRYNLTQDRSLVFLPETQEHVMQSGTEVSLEVQGAVAAHHSNKPIKFVSVFFTNGPFDADRAGNLFKFDLFASVVATMPHSDFPAFWAAISLHPATVLCDLAVRSDGTVTDRVLGLKVSARKN